MRGVSTEDFWTWTKTDIIGYDRHPYLDIDRCVKLYRELWLDLGKCMWRKHRSVYQDHMKYVRNDIVKPFKVKILRYTDCVDEMHDLAKYLPTYLMKGQSETAAYWSVRNEGFTNSDLRLAIKDGDDHPEGYRFLTYEYWCGLLSTIKVKD